VRRDASASAPPGCISFKRKAFCFLLYWNASQEKPARALAKATRNEIGYLERGRKGKGRRNGENGEKGQGKAKGVPSKLPSEGKAVQFLGCFWMLNGKALPKEPVLLCRVSFFRWPERRSVGLRSTVSTPRGRVCACTDSGSLTTRETNRCCHPCLQSVPWWLLAPLLNLIEPY